MEGLTPQRRMGLLWITHPFLKSISKILGLPNVWSSDLLVRSMSLNSQTLGCAWESLLDVGFGFGVGFGFSFGAAVGV